MEEELEKNANLFPKDRDLYLFCRSGMRSVVALSLLEKSGYERVFNVVGGFTEICKNDVEEII